MTMIDLLHCAAAGDRNIGPVTPYGGHPLADEIEGSLDSADSIMDFSRPVEGNDDVVEELRYLLCPFQQQQSGGQESEMNILLSKERTECA